MFSRVAASSSKALGQVAAARSLACLSPPSTCNHFPQPSNCRLMSGCSVRLRPTSSKIAAAKDQHILFSPPPDSRNFSQAQNQESTGEPKSTTISKSIPTKETLFRIDWMLENLIPRLFRSPIMDFFEFCDENVEFQDTLFNYNLRGKNSLNSHIAKVKLYFRYKSPFNKLERIGSCVYENEDVVVVLWRFETLRSSIWTYLPKFITRREPKVNVIEGAMDVHVNGDGFIYKIVNRKITASDREGARAMEKIKQESAEKQNASQKGRLQGEKAIPKEVFA